MLVCNLYSITTNQVAIIALFRVVNQYVGNLPPMEGVFRIVSAPVVRNEGERELVMTRWDVTDRWRPCCKRVQVGRRPQHVTVSSPH